MWGRSLEKGLKFCLCKGSSTSVPFSKSKRLGGWRAALGPMFSATAWHSVLRPANLNPAFSLSARIFQGQRYALSHNTARLRSRASPVLKFYASDFLSATHKSAAWHARRDWQPPGPLRKLRRWFDNIPQNYIVFGILGLNGVVFAAWSYVQLFQVRCPLVSRHQPHPNKRTHHQN